MSVHSGVISIGALAKAAGVSAPTIRYYEQIGLLRAPRRSASGSTTRRISNG
nr:MerR family DNA-binding transcriptional regulator [Paracoccus caeni]